jgi:hypothetical protein
VGRFVAKVRGGGLRTDVQGDAVRESAGRTEACDGGPAVWFARGVADRGCPVRQGKAQIAGEGGGVGLVETADGGEPVAGLKVRTEGEADTRERGAEAGELIVTETGGRLRAESLLVAFLTEDVTKIDQGVAADSEG